MKLSIGDHGSRPVVRVGDTIELHLPENPTTGFRWTLLPNPAVVIESAHMDAVAPAPGAAGQRVLRLRALQSGEHRVQLRCEREWEGASTATGHFEVTLIVA